MLVIGVGMIVIGVYWFVRIVIGADAGTIPVGSAMTQIIASLCVDTLGTLILFGLFTLQPNEARVLILFGSYKGTVRVPGFHWANPFYARSRGRAPITPGEAATGTTAQRARQLMMLSRLPTKISLRAHNFNSDQLKVNDKNGNPIEIAAVVVWRVADTAQAVFDVDDYDSYVEVQSESAIRTIASLYSYDQGEDDEITLRSGGEEISRELTRELQERLDKAGVHVEEARLTHLAYAPEIASAMLRRQQAEAVISARAKIVLGAVSMVEMALRELEAKAVIDLDPERRAAMVSNLLVVLCGTAEASPVINTGSLYT
jgi:regulator of protease activity HflC (stomatin/prohibitin superfamily)